MIWDENDVATVKRMMQSKGVGDIENMTGEQPQYLFFKIALYALVRTIEEYVKERGPRER